MVSFRRNGEQRGGAFHQTQLLHAVTLDREPRAYRPIQAYASEGMLEQIQGMSFQLSPIAGISVSRYQGLTVWDHFKPIDFILAISP